MLKNDFYTCYDTLSGDHELSCRLVFKPEHAIFKGHFPGNPVVPGVCMIEIVKELLQEQVNESLVLESAGNVKFLQIISPEMQPMIKISWQKNEHSYSVKASINLEAAPLFKFDGHYTSIN